MADTKLADLTDLPTPAMTDLLYVVADPGGTPVDRKATIAAVLALVPPSGGGDIALLDHSRPNITVTNTTTETDVYSVTIPGGTLGTAGTLRLTLYGGKVKNGGGADTAMIMKVYYGATTLATLPVPSVEDDHPAVRSMVLTVLLTAAGATNAQKAHTMLHGNRNVGSRAVNTVNERATAAEDSTAAKVLRVTWTQSATTAQSYTSDLGIIEAL